MTGSVEVLPHIQIEGHESSGLGDERHPMRVITRRIAGLAPGGWDAEVSNEVVGVFDELAPEWHSRTSAQRTAVVEDALNRGFDASGRHLAVEVGAGIGTYSGLLAERFNVVVSLDLSMEMTRRAPSGPSHRLLADGGLLPVRDRSVDAVVLINAFLFPNEVTRVLHVGGTLIWVNSSGEETPIHLSTKDVVSVLPFPVEGRESRAGAGTWCVLRRTA
ncbi:MAG: class I SAM-dependent methyltransferase [Acidimicrobiia bacterium]